MGRRGPGLAAEAAAGRASRVKPARGRAGLGVGGRDVSCDARRTLGTACAANLDWIVLKALSLERERPLTSRVPRIWAEGTCARHLRHEPISAGPPSTL